MRPVNLVPPEERRGERTPARTGAAIYGLLGLLAVALLGVTMVVLANNDISQSRAQITELEAKEAAARTEADRLRAFADFASVQQTREQTVSTLARSRFDWERVLNELAIVIPNDVWLTDVTATVAPGVQLGGGTNSALRSGVAGPALSLIGCGSGHQAVAEFAAALEDIDGVTRVGVERSEMPGQQSGSGGSGTTDCRTRDFVAQFEIVAAFDAVQVDQTTGMPVAPAEVPTTDDGGVAGAQAQEREARDSIDSGVEKGQDAAEIVPGVVIR